MEEDDDHSRRSRRGRPSLTSALLEAISRSRSTETSRPNRREYPIHALRRSADDFTVDRRNWNCCDSSSCKWKNVATPHMGRNALQMPKVKDMDMDLDLDTSCKRKPRQPMSPGSKLASFLNSLFVPTSIKRKSQGVPSDHSGRGRSREKEKEREKAASRSVSSSSSTPHFVDFSQRYDAPSFYHTKHKHDNPPCGNKEQNRNNRRCVTFDPASVILKRNEEENALGKQYSATKVVNSRNGGSDSDSDSVSSSDLFELNNFNAMDIYSTDLPVYETTHLETNKAIAKGLL